MPYIDCTEAQCDYPEHCFSDHWVPATQEAPKEEEPKCDHYWLTRKGGRCRTCGKEFPGNFGRK